MRRASWFWRCLHAPWRVQPPTEGQRWLVSRVTRLAGGRVAAAALSALWLMVAARLLPMKTFGDLVLLLGLGMLFVVVNDFGLPLALTDAVVDDSSVGRSALVRVAGRRAGLGLASVVLVVGAYHLASERPDAVAAAVFSVSVLATTVYTTATAFFRAHGRVRVEAANEVVSRLFVLGAGTWWLSSGGGLRAAVTVYAAADVASAVVLGLVAWRATRGAGRLIDPGRLALRRVAPIAVAAALAVFYYRVDLWLLALLGDARDVALYGSAYRVLDGALLAATAVGALSVTAVARQAPDQRHRALGRMVVLALAVTAPFVLAAGVAAGPLMTTLFGTPYEDASGLLRILTVAAVPSVMVTVVGPLAFLRGRSAAARVFAVSLVVDVVLNLALVPAHGAAGAAWATLVGQVLLAVLLWRVVRGRAVTCAGADADGAVAATAPPAGERGSGLAAAAPMPAG